MFLDDFTPSVVFRPFEQAQEEWLQLDLKRSQAGITRRRNQMIVDEVIFHGGLCQTKTDGFAPEN